MTLEVDISGLAEGDSPFVAKLHISSDGGDASHFVPTASVSRTGSGAAVRVTVDRSAADNTYRSEWSSSTTFHHADGVPYWFAMSVFVPPDYQFDTQARCIVAQLHDAPDEGDNAGPPPMIVYIDTDGRWHVDLLYNTQSAGTQTPGANVQVLDQAYDAVTTGWHDFLWYFVGDYSGGGVFRLWHNGSPWIKYAGALGYNNAVGWYSKCGVYISEWRSSPETDTDTTQQILYFDEIRIGDASESWASMRVNAANPYAATASVMTDDE